MTGKILYGEGMTGLLRSGKQIAVIDGGTTNTRVYIVDGNRVGRPAIISSASRPVGVRDTALDGSKSRLLSAVYDALSDALNTTRSEQPEIIVESAVCLGMLTSPLGLYEVPHISAPVGIDDLASSLRCIPCSKLFGESVSDGLPNKFAFIPGVKTLDSEERIEMCDFMRGEEVQVLGILRMLEITKPSLFIILGSHTKLIYTDVQGRIAGSLTTMAGELTSAFTSSTILASSLPKTMPDTREPDLEMVFKGAQLVQDAGLTRAAFVVRLADQLGSETQERCFDFLSGAIGMLDVQALIQWSVTRTSESVYIVGNPYRTLVYEALLSRIPALKFSITRIGKDGLMFASITGAVEVLRKVAG